MSDMNKEIMHLSPTQAHSQSLEIIAPVSTRMLFSRARYLDSSAFLYHVPFLFWLIEVSRPKVFVELGVNDGVSYFAACQAIDKLDLDAQCHGIVLQGENENIPDSIETYNTQHYAEFSRLYPQKKHETVHQLADASIDLLHINIQDLSILDCLNDDWISKLSPQGIVLLHGTKSHSSHEEAQNFIDDLVASYPSITLDGGEGLTAVLCGEEQDDRLLRLADLTFGMTGYSDIHHVFSRLGSAHSFESAARIEGEQAASLRKKYETSENALQKSEKERETLNKRVEALDLIHQARGEQIAVLQGKLFDLQAAQEKNEVEDIAKRDAALADAQKTIQDQKTELDKLKAEMATRFNEIAILTRTLDTKEKQHAATLIASEKVQAEYAKSIAMRDTALADSRREVEDLKAQVATRFKETATLTRMLETAERKVLAAHQNDMRVLQQELADARNQRDDILNSRSWKITKPLRKAMSIMRK